MKYYLGRSSNTNLIELTNQSEIGIFLSLKINKDIVEFDNVVLLKNNKYARVRNFRKRGNDIIVSLYELQKIRSDKTTYCGILLETNGRIVSESLKNVE